MTAAKRTIDVDAATAAALESRAAETGLSVPELLADLVARHSEPARVPPSELAELDRQWAAIKAGELTVPHDGVVRWLDTWGTRDPFAAFSEWSGQADENAYRAL